MLHVVIPGRPAAQGRPRAAARGHHASVYEDAKSRNAKAFARDAMVRECERRDLSLPAYPCDLLAVSILCVFPLPKGDERKTPVPRAWLENSRFDVDNLAKLYLDAGNGVLYEDDGQVVRLEVERWRGAQGESARTEMTVEVVP